MIYDVLSCVENQELHFYNIRRSELKDEDFTHLCLCDSDHEALHRLEHTLNPKKAKFQGHCSNKLDVKLSFVYYIIV